ncbi:hypothetical protein [Corynebacterium gerontici]|uniref:Uncharacterized protein n=1 Tax=Corynebacterium gerontici TaxID=2079234 RepID=A0A3G6IYF1_9CORY|nr:hypothetical protein [Corynebacterium gerontici]AZA10811.1 hypothetical protein CGERO_02435 [Corynebacterium gerontici]
MSNNEWGSVPPPTPAPSAPAPKSKRPLLWGLLALAVVLVVIVVALGLRQSPEQPQAEASKSKQSTAPSAESSTQETRQTTTVTQTEEVSVDPCSPGVINAQALSEGRFQSSECLDGWMYGGIPQTDAVSIYQWDGQKWQWYKPHGETFTGFDCYNLDQMRADGAPEEIVQQVSECKPRSLPSTFIPEQPSCDGRNVLIVESVIIHPGDDADKEIAQALGRHIGAKFTNPGQCSSLRAEAEGGKVYPVYYDFGRDASAMCQRKAEIGGNGRTLNNSADFSDPCE